MLDRTWSNNWNKWKPNHTFPQFVAGTSINMVLFFSDQGSFKPMGGRDTFDLEIDVSQSLIGGGEISLLSSISWERSQDSEKCRWPRTFKTYIQPKTPARMHHNPSNRSAIHQPSPKFLHNRRHIWGEIIELDWSGVRTDESGTDRRVWQVYYQSLIRSSEPVLTQVSNYSWRFNSDETSPL